MIYISAQPDTDYFLWQLEVQIHNFHSMGIAPEQIHVLIGYQPAMGINKNFDRLLQSTTALFFTYPDERGTVHYQPTIRPHLLKQHFQQHAWLQQQAVFYHDSDIVFRELPDENRLELTENWYLSATPYISSTILKRHAGEKVLHELYALTGVLPEVAERNEAQTGGAQYVFKNISWKFWEKIEADCEAIYNYMTRYNEQEGKALQSWCADMWAILWNGWRQGYPIAVDSELDFCMPDEDISRWYHTKILHVTGVLLDQAEALFCKGIYRKTPPYFNNFSSLDKHKCSVKYAEIITRTEVHIPREDLRDVTFIFPVRMHSSSHLYNLDLATRYISKHFHTHIAILEMDDIPRINRNKLPAGIEYVFCADERQLFNAAKELNRYIPEVRTPFIAICDAETLVPHQQLLEAVVMLRNQAAAFVLPYNKGSITIDQRSLDTLKISLDDIPASNVTSALCSPDKAYSSWSLFNRDSYIRTGMENEMIAPWGYYNYMERAKRLNILKQKGGNVKGAFLQLPGYIPPASEQSVSNQLINGLEGYLGICSLQQDALMTVVEKWSWVTAAKAFTKDHMLASL